MVNKDVEEYKKQQIQLKIDKKKKQEEFRLNLEK